MREGPAGWLLWFPGCCHVALRLEGSEVSGLPARHRPASPARRWACRPGGAGGDPPASAGKSSSKRRSSDIISLLVSIYGSKDLFINEYRSLLADRLLHQFSFSPER